MWQDIWYSVVGSPTQSPEPERANQAPSKNTNDLKEYLDWYFSDLNKQYKNNKSSEREKAEAKRKLAYFSFPEIVPQQLSLAPPTEIIKYLVDNIKSLTPEILKIRDNHITDKDIQNLSNYLRNNKTVKEVHLDNCQMNDKKVKVLADIFKLNETITTLSLSINKEITNIGVKTLLKLKESNPNLKCVKVGFYDTYNVYCPAENIFNIDIATEPSPLFNNQIIRQNTEINKSAKLELQSMVESYNEITGKGNTQNMVVVAGESNGMDLLI